MSGTIMYPTDGKNPYAFPKTFKEWSESVKDAWINLATHSDFIPEGHTQVLVIRPNEGYGNSFNSLRVAIKNDSGTIKVFTEMVGANAKESMAKKYEGMTRPDGDYYYTTKPLYPQNDGTYNSNSFINVLREVTNDPRIPENVRNSINN